jgi:hypothetical protein
VAIQYVVATYSINRAAQFGSCSWNCQATQTSSNGGSTHENEENYLRCDTSFAVLDRSPSILSIAAAK